MCGFLSRFQIFCGVLLVVAAFRAYSVEPITIDLPKPTSVGFAGSELEVSISLQNPNAEQIEASLSTRLWQQSASTVMPVSPARPWWSGKIEGNGKINAVAPVSLPEVRAAVRFQLHLLSDDARTLAKVPIIAIPKNWFGEQLSHLPGELALYDPDARISSALRLLEVKFREIQTVEEAAAIPKALCVLAPAATEADRVLDVVNERAARGQATAIVVDALGAAEKEAAGAARGSSADYTNLQDSAGAQFRFVTLLQQALRLKNPTNSRGNTPEP